MMLTLKEFLRSEVRPALGCTEPGSVALAVARACAELTDRDEIAAVRVTVSASIYKNGMAVGVPGTKGGRGNAIAAAMGAICGEPSLGLEVLAKSTAADLAKAEEWVRDERVTIYCDPDRSGVYILASVFTPGHKAVCLLENSHTHISRVYLDNELRYEADKNKASAAGFFDDFPAKLKDALKMAEEIDEEDVEFIWEGIEMNYKVAKSGLGAADPCADRGCMTGTTFGAALRDFGGAQLSAAAEIRSLASAAAEARMSGIRLPVMSSAGSGNHGITAILPVAALGRLEGKGEFETAKAVAVSHIATSFVKHNLGRLSPLCGCAVAAGAGAAAGMTYLLGGDFQQICTAMSLLLANIAGMFCDGAKESCALKVGSAAAEAYHAAKWALRGQKLAVPQGIFGATIEETVTNVSRLSLEGMRTADRVMIEILDKRHRPASVAY